MVDPFTTPISRWIWETRYRAAGEAGLPDTWRRVARAVAEAEADPERWEPAFFDALQGFGFLPAGRILAGAGRGAEVTLLNCFVMGELPDDLDGLLQALQDGARTMGQGGGVGYDFSTLSPAGSRQPSGRRGPGPLAAMRLWDAMCGLVSAAGARRGAMMATLRCDHPDIEAFIDAKADPRELRRFNVSVQVTDALLQAVQGDADWPLHFAGRVYRVVRARALWERILRATWSYAEPGVLFVDHVAAADNLAYVHRITATNPCGEIPMQPWGACDLGSLNLVSFVRDPFTAAARLDLAGMAARVPVAVRFLDSVLDVTAYPLPQQAEQARLTRRIGLGITGLGDALVMLGLPYDSEAARALAGEVMRTLAVAAYRASVDLAREKGPFPLLDLGRHLERPFLRRLPEDLRADIARDGLRNSHLLAIAPTGTISLLANNVSSGLEPPFAARYTRDVIGPDGPRTLELVAASCRVWEAQGRSGLPPAFVRSDQVSPEAQLAMQAALQRWVDNAVSKTIVVPEALPFDRFRDVYERAWALGLKGCTTWRPNPVTGSILAATTDACPDGCAAPER